MIHRQGFLTRPLAMFVIVAAAFSAGILVERSGRILAPYQYTPAGMESTFSPFWQSWDAVQKHYVDREAVNPQRMTRAAIEGMLASLGDPGHTIYLPPDDRKSLESALAGSVEGIGIRINFAGRKAAVLFTYAGSPARAAGLRSGDQLLEVNSKDVRGMSPDRIAALIRGPLEGKVHIRVLRPGEPQPLEFDVARAKVDVPDVAWSMLPGLPIAHLAVESFGDKVHDQLKAALEEIRKKGAKGIVLDLRGNQGGIKDQAVTVSSEFLKDGNVFLERDANGNQIAVPVREGASAADIPVCLLIDGGTASSAEIVAGALQDHGRGKLIGTHTLGFGTLLQRFVLIDNSAVLIAVAEWLTPNGRRIWRQGIAPDIVVNLPDGASVMLPEMEGDLAAAGRAGKIEDKQLLKAIEILSEQIHP